MKYLVELDDKTTAGRELLFDVRKRLTDDGVKLVKTRKLTDAELRKHLTRPMKKPVDFDKAIERISVALKKAS